MPNLTCGYICCDEHQITCQGVAVAKCGGCLFWYCVAHFRRHQCDWQRDRHPDRKADVGGEG